MLCVCFNDSVFAKKHIVTPRQKLSTEIRWVSKMEITFLNYICVIIRRLGGNMTFSHLTHKLDLKVSSVEQTHPGGSMCVASPGISLKESSASLDHEGLAREKRK